jgi:hypothetical protein
MTGADADHQVIADEITLNQAPERQESYAAYNGSDTFDMLLALPYVLVSPASGATTLVTLSYLVILQIALLPQCD